jgi:hypothetical protein
LLFPLLCLAVLVPARGQTDGKKAKTVEPISVRQVLLSPERLPAELKRLADGLLVRLPKSEFEAKLKQARTPAVPPRLVEARYRAALADLVLSGNAQWRVAYKGATPALLNLQPDGQPFTLALLQPRWENREALIADFDGKSLALLVDQEGERTVNVDWTARVEARPDGLHVDLRVPASPVAILELNLAADQSVASLDGAVASGPHPAEKADRRLWKIVCSGKNQVRLVVRKGQGGAGPPLVLARLRTQQRMAPDGLDAEYAFDLEVLHQAVTELALVCDPNLRPTEVLVPDLDSWELKPGSKPNAASTLIVKLRKPLREGTLTVRAMGPLGAPIGSGIVAWTSPGMRLEKAVPRGEALELLFHPDIRISEWKTGGFRITGSSKSEASAQTSRLTLAGGGLASPGSAAEPPVQRPTALIQSRGTGFRARQQAWWRVGPDAMELTLQIAYEVEFGRLFQLPVLLPAGWEVETLEVSPALLRDWTVRPYMGRPLLRVELRHPLKPVAKAGRTTLKVRLRPSGNPQLVNVDLPFPSADPLGARFREGSLAVDVDSQACRAILRTGASTAEPDANGPWKDKAPTAYYSYQAGPVAGVLKLIPLETRLRGRAHTEVFVASNRAAVEMNLTLQAESGSINHVDLLLTAPAGPEPWVWHAKGGAGNRVRESIRLANPLEQGLALLAASNPLQSAVLLAGCLRGEQWRLKLERPLRMGETVTLRTTREIRPIAPGEPTGQPSWNIPLPTFDGVGGSKGEVTLHVARADLVQIQASGLREAAPDAPKGTAKGRAATFWREFRYGLSAPPGAVRLNLSGRGAPLGRKTEAIVDRAALVTTVHAGGELRHLFTFNLTGWPLRTIPLPLPDGARLLGAAVNGRWIVDIVHEPDGGFALPVPRSEGMNRFEITYSTPGSNGLLPWRRLDSPAPRLPIEPLAFERRWRLPPGLQPLTDSHYLRQAGSGEGPGAPIRSRNLADLFRLTPPAPYPWKFRESQAERRQALADASASLRSGRAGRALPLGLLVEIVAIDYLKNSHPFVVDALALEEAEVNPKTPMAVRAPASPDDRALPWEARGLVAVPGKGAVLLTSQREADRWLVGPDPQLSEDLEEALTEAVAAGQDPSGRFRTALNWLRGEHPETKTPSPSLLSSKHDLDGWTQWAPVAGYENGDTLIAVRGDRMAALGVLVAASLLLILWAGRRWPARRKLLFLLACLSTAGLGIIWLPRSLQGLAWWPLLGSSAWGLVWYLVWSMRGVSIKDPSPSSRRIRLAGGAAGILALIVLLAGGLAGRGATQPVVETATIFLVPGPDGEPGKDTVLVPPRLLRRLAELGKPSFAPGSGAVLLAANYEGKLVKGVAEFDAVFQVHALSEEPGALLLPLDGVQLRGDVLLDGARAFPVAAAAPKVGYFIRVKGKGRHKIELKFRVPARVVGEAQTIIFTGPRLAQNRLVLQLPPGASHGAALVKLGGQRLTGSLAGGQRLEVDLGPVAAPVTLRWFQQAGPAKANKIEFREAHYWDLRVDASTLTTQVNYQLTGAAPSLEIDLPPQLEVRSATASRVGGGPAVRLRDWSVTGTGPNRTVKLEFPGPVSGGVEVTLDLVPQGPLPASITLPVPRPKGQALPGVSYLAYSTSGIEATRTSWLRVSGVNVKEFAPFWQGASRPATGTLAHAYTFRREGSASPEVRLKINPLPARLTAVQELTLRATAAHLAEVRAALTLTAPDKDLALVEWEMQSPRPMTIAAVNGPDVARWTQSGDRLLVWLERPTALTRLELTGWLPLSDKPPKKQDRPVPKSSKWLEAPCLRVSGAQSVETKVRLLAEHGLALNPGTLRNLAVQPGTKPNAAERLYQARQPTYGGTFLVQAAEGPSVRVLTRAALRGQAIAFTSTLECRPVRGGLRELRIGLRQEGNGEAMLDAPKNSVGSLRELRRPGERRWILDLKPELRGPYTVRVHGTIPLDAAAAVVLPELSVDGAEATEQAVILAEGLAVEASTGVKAMPALNSLKRWAGYGAGRAWKVVAAPWQMRVAPTVPGAGNARVEVLLEENSAAVLDGNRWLFETIFWLRQAAPTDLTVKWERGVKVLDVAVDGGAISTVRPDPARLWLPLAGRVGIRAVRLRWQGDPESHPLDRPQLTRPTLESVPQGPVVWTLNVPPGWQARALNGGAPLTGPLLSAAQELARASVQFESSRDLAERTREGTIATSLSDLQSNFYFACRRVRQGLAESAANTNQAGLAAQLRDLLDKNQALASRFQFDEIRKKAERDVEAGLDLPESPFGPRFSIQGQVLPVSGTTLMWRLGPTDATPEVDLNPVQDRNYRSALADSLQWLSLILLAGLISFSPPLRGLMRRLWPELLTLAGILGWYVAGPTAVTLFLLLFGLAGRANLAAAWLRDRFRPSTKQGSSLGKVIPEA